jgi:hypothetical protein
MPDRIAVKGDESSQLNAFMAPGNRGNDAVLGGKAMGSVADGSQPANGGTLQAQTQGQDETASDEAINGGAPSQRKGLLSRFRKGKGGASKQEKAPNPTSKELQAKLKTLNDAIATLTKSGFDGTQMRADALDFAKQAVKAEGETDEKKRADAIKAIGDRIDEGVEHLGALSKSMKDVMGKSKDKPNKGQKSKIYQKALEDYYGQTISVQPGMEGSTHFDKVFDMFGTVPKGDTKQDQLKKLTYTTTLDGDAFSGGAYGGKEIYMGDFGDAKGLEDDGDFAYELNGKPASANSFNVTTLHEIGHAVDKKNSIMVAPAQSGGGYGGWVDEGLAKVVTALLAELKKAGPFSAKTTDDLLKTAVQTALSAGTTVQPPTIENDDWAKILPFLNSNCLPIRDAGSPYSSNSPVAVGDRVYTESQGTWYSYALSSRRSTRVNNYQWRSPAEWFAEIYAITYLKKSKPPSAVDGNVAKFCWRG